MSWKVVFHQSTRGDYPVKDFVESQSETVIAKIAHSLLLLSEYGPFLKPPYMKKVQSSLFELRVHSTIAIRIFYSKHKDTFVLLHGFIKKTQKTPQKEIATALDRMKEYI